MTTLMMIVGLAAGVILIALVAWDECVATRNADFYGREAERLARSAAATERYLKRRRAEGWKPRRRRK